MLLIGLSLLLLATAISSSTHKKLAINKVTNESNMVESVHASFSIEKEAAEKIDLTNRNNESLTETQMEEVKFSPHIIIRITFLLLLFSAYLSYNSNYIDNINYVQMLSRTSTQDLVTHIKNHVHYTRLFVSFDRWNEQPLELIK